MEALLLLVAQVAVRAQHDLQEAGEVFFTEAFRHARHSLALVGRNLQDWRIAPRDFGDQHVAQEADHLPRKMLRALSFDQQLSTMRSTSGLELFAATASITSSSMSEETVPTSPRTTSALRVVPQHAMAWSMMLSASRMEPSPTSASIDSASSSAAMPSCLAMFAQLLDDLVKAHGVKAEVLAARANRLRNILRLRRRHHENHVPGRLFQRLQQRVEGSVSNLVRFVEDPNLVAIASRTVTRGVAQLANLVDAAIGGSVDLDHIHRVPRADFAAGVAHPARLWHRMVLRLAIQRHGQNARDGGFADAAVSAEDVAVRDTLLLDGVLQGAGDVVLPDDFGELLWPVFAGKNLVAHGRKV